MALTKGINFEINQRLVRIVENKDAPDVDYIPQMLHVKLAPVLSQVKHGAMSSSAPSKQGGYENEELVLNEPIVNVLKELIKIKSPYVVLKLIKGADAPKIQIG